MGDLGLNIYWQGVGLFLFFFYTDVMKISPFWAGTTILIASLWDAVTDVWIAGAADRTETRFGRYRPFLLTTPPFLALSFTAMFYVPVNMSGTSLVIYALVTHLIFRTLYTCYAIPYSTLSVKIAPDSDSRGLLASTRMQAAAIGGLTVATGTPAIVAYFGNFTDTVSNAWLLTACGMSLVATTVMWVCFFGTKEGTILDSPNTHKGILSDLLTISLMLRRNEPLLLVFLCISLASLCLAMLGKTLLYWFKYSLNDEASAGLALVIGPLLLIACAPLWAAYSRRTSKHHAWRTGCAITVFGCLAFFALPMDTTLSVCLALGVIGIGTSSFAVMFWSMLPDTVEYDQWISGETHEAKVFGFASFAQKAALGLNAFFLGLLLDLVGFAPNLEQSEATLLGLKAIMTLIPAAGGIATYLILRRYPLDASLHTKIREELAARKSD
jgi:GPH family glycoside/pentoside/hexuronide:cation symporter